MATLLEANERVKEVHIEGLVRTVHATRLALHSQFNVVVLNDEKASLLLTSDLLFSQHAFVGHLSFPVIIPSNKKRNKTVTFPTPKQKQSTHYFIVGLAKNCQTLS